MKICVVGSGISGAVAAYLLSQSGHKVEIFETRSHIAGNCYDEILEGVLVHKYGPHLFHTNDTTVWNLLSRFTDWSNYSHKVVADTSRGRIPIPYNFLTEKQIGCRLTDQEIIDLIFIDYSEKQWGVPWSKLPASITGRVPKRRENSDDRYFTDHFQGQPKDGYRRMFEQMLEGIVVHLDVGKDKWRDLAENADLVVYTGKIDEYFGFCYGNLPYRSLRFEHQFSMTGLPNAVINQCNQLPYTRMYDHSYFNPTSNRVEAKGTIITHEYPLEHDPSNEPYYPVPFGEGMATYQKYKALAEHDTNVIFLGRLATYSYLDMWMAVAQTIKKLSAQVGTIITS